MWPNGTEGSSVESAASVTSIYIYFNVRYVDGIASDKVVAIESNFASYPYTLEYLLALLRLESVTLNFQVEQLYEKFNSDDEIQVC
jgi:hypothetical protein